MQQHQIDEILLMQVDDTEFVARSDGRCTFQGGGGVLTDESIVCARSSEHPGMALLI